jgi:hypothetical protein
MEFTALVVHLLVLASSRRVSPKLRLPLLKPLTLLQLLKKRRKKMLPLATLALRLA